MKIHISGSIGSKNKRKVPAKPAPLSDQAKAVLAKGREAIVGDINANFTKEEQYEITHRPVIALVYARYLAETANMYAWSGRVEYTHRASQRLRELITLDRPEGMDVTEWHDFKQQAIGFVDGFLAKDLTKRLQLACRLAVENQARGIDNLDLRAWALASITALDAMEELERHYSRLIRSRLDYLGESFRVITDPRVAADLRSIMRTYTGFDIRTQTLDDFAKEITNCILSIKFVNQ